MHRLKHLPKISRIDIFGNSDQAFRQRELLRSHQSERRLHCFLLIPLFDGNDEKVVKARFVVCPHAFDLRVEELGKRSENLLRSIAEKFVLHRGNADNRGGVDRILPSRDGSDMKDREFSCGRIVSEVIAERFLASPFLRWHVPFEDKFRICRNGDRDRSSSDKLGAFLAKESGEQRLVNSFRQREPIIARSIAGSVPSATASSSGLSSLSA